MILYKDTHSIFFFSQDQFSISDGALTPSESSSSSAALLFSSSSLSTTITASTVVSSASSSSSSSSTASSSSSTSSLSSSTTEASTFWSSTLTKTRICSTGPTLLRLTRIDSSRTVVSNDPALRNSPKGMLIPRTSAPLGSSC